MKLSGALTVVVGSMLGVGIFLAPPEMASSLPSASWLLAIWGLAIFDALAGAVTYSALGVRRPKAGADPVYQAEALGPSVGLATGWLLFLGAFCGTSATLAAALFEYPVSSLLGVQLGAELLLGVPLSRWLALLVILALSLPIAAGARIADPLLRPLSWIPLLLLLGLCLDALVFIDPIVSSAPARTPAQESLTPHGLLQAWLAAHFAMAGWNAVSYLAEDLEAPRRDLPRAMIGGALLVGGVYLLVNISMLRVLGLDGLRDAGEAGTALAAAVGGERGARGMAALIALGMSGTLMASLWGGSRVALALLRQQRAADHDEHTLPLLGVQALTCGMLVLSGSASLLLEATGLVMVSIGGLSTISLFVFLRRESREASARGEPAPTLGWGLPWLPAMNLVLVALVLGAELQAVIDGEVEALAILGPALWLLIAGGSWAWRRRRSSPAPP